MSEKIRRVAVVGSGFAGLSLAFQLVKRGIGVDIFEDPTLPSASSIATGLLHLFHGMQARVPPLGEAAMQASLEQLSELDALNDAAKKITLIRPAINKMQTSIFAKRARQYPQKTEYKPLPWDEETQALWIHDAYWIDSATYLKRLRQFLEQKQCRFIEARITDSKELEKDYDRIILACGYGSVLLKEIKELNLEGHLTRGQLAELNLQSPPPFALNGKTYLIPKTLSANETTPWIMGSTFEKLPLDTDHFDHKTFDPEARQKLCEQSQALWSSVEPETAQWQIGYRLAGPDHLPYLSKISPKTYVFTGLGSKGLLYSTLLAQKLVERIIGNPGSFHFQIYAAKDAIYR